MRIPFGRDALVAERIARGYDAGLALLPMQPGDVIAERFELERLVGEGAMGTVWRARDRREGTPVAIKIERGVESERVVREAKVLAEMRSDAIVKLIAYGTDPRSGTWLAIEWIEGHDLMKELEKGPMPLIVALALARRLASAIGALHAQGILHRDVKPTNIMLPGGHPEQAKLLDLGLARVQSAPRTTRQGQTLGTPGYMAPEQARGLVELDARADVFSVGCVLFECIAGQPVFAGDHYVAILAKVLMQDIPRLSDVVSGVPTEIDELVSRMLAKDPKERPENGAALEREIDAALERVASSGGDVALRRVDSGPPVTLSESEAYIASVVLVSAGIAPASDAMESLRNLATSIGASIEMLPDGAIFALLARRGHAREQAAAAARLALALHVTMPNRVCVLSTGRTALGARTLVGEAIDRASALLASPATSGVRVDEVTAGLLGTRFLIEQQVLFGERDASDDPRTVLGKAVPCVGREREVATLEGLQEESASGLARVVLLTGAGGIGKSRVLHELVQRLRKRDPAPAVWIGRGDPMSAGSPLVILADALRRALSLHFSEPIEERRRKILARAPERIAWFIGEMVGSPFDAKVSVQIASARKDAQLMADQMRQAFEDFVLAELAQRPVVLVLEDLQWGDAALVSFVDSLLRVAEQKPLLVIATGRGDLHQRFPQLWERRHPTEIKLAELTVRASGQLVRAMLPAIPAERVGVLVERAAGNALFLEELVRAEAEGRGASTPGSVLAMVTSRLDALAPEVRRTLRAASVFGRTTWRGALQTLSRLDATTLAAHLEELGQREILVRMPDAKFASEEEYLFRHEIVREAAYRMLTDADRAIAHAQAAKWLEKAGERDALVLAEHFEKGGLNDRAIKHYLRATQQALDSSGLDAAYAYAERGIALGATWETCGELRSRQADIALARGQNDRVRDLGDLALADLEPKSAAWCQAAALLAIAELRLSNVDRAHALSRQLLEGPKSPTSPYLRVAMTLLLYGHVELAEALSEKGAAVIKLPVERCRLHEYRQLRKKMQGDLSAAIAESELSIQAAQEANNVRLVVQAQTNLGDTLKELGAYDRASALLAEAVRSADRIGYDQMGCVARQNLAFTRAREGAVEEGIEIGRTAARMLDQQGDIRMAGFASAYIAMILFDAGDLAQAETHARSAIEVLAGTEMCQYANAILARILTASGRAREAFALARDALAFLEGGGHMEEGESVVRLAVAETLVALRDPSARQAIVDARRVLLERASRISDDDLRRVFLERIPEHARTTELYVWQNTAANSGGA